ncbi:FAD-dependent oxidoreductase [Streptomyces zagrosensis]|uniref:ferredoxin--NADP(+) reductase n=1 Tax=Streptomyces zagrosensis TaxID=1042984 RepID=A0A7W9QDX8_9ACTN|nr:FAD-dependent oxidoreductase [Streptomyces zagrosensis]MBB5938485.1 ferredoxin--NADP+ reductase [Streptomyces zagrosensis]
MLRIAVVGSGPSGVYTAQALLQQRLVPDVAVHVLDRLPCPFGLVRYGVAPDHEKIKSLQGNLRTVLEDPRVTFLGNVRVGEFGLTPRQLSELYHAVVYCIGAAADRPLGVPGEELAGSCSATEFVSWYSAHPDAAADPFALATPSAVVIGVGNVAVDVARVLAREAAELRSTDVPDAALAVLGRSRVRDIHMVGRRGPSQAKFTTKELRELGALPGAEVRVQPDELAIDPAFADPSALPAVNRRNVEVLRGWATQPTQGRQRRIHLRFFLRPVALLGPPSGPGAHATAEDGADPADAAGSATAAAKGHDGAGVAGVRAVRFERTAPDGHGGVVGTGRYEDIEAQLVLRSVGYRGVPLAGLPFDPDRGTVPHLAGRVLRDGAPSAGEYVAGWIKRGPTGVIGTNRPCAKETVASLLADAPDLAARVVATDALTALRALGQDPVEWPGWVRIEQAEAALGRELGRTNVKIADWESLLSAARTAR